jgi:cell division protein FtsZ
VISNDKLRHQFGNLTMKAAFSKADNVLATAAKCITDVINSTGQINVDFADVCTVMRNGGVAILGSAACEGGNRAQQAIEDALNSPLLNDNDIKGAKWILININSSEGENEFTMDEVETIQNYLLSHAGEDTDVILGLGYDASLDKKIGITLIATGFEHKSPFEKKQAVPTEEKKKDEKIVMTLDASPELKKSYQQPALKFSENIEQNVQPKEEPVLKTTLPVVKDMTPQIVDLPATGIVKAPSQDEKTTVEKFALTIGNFELSSESNIKAATPDSDTGTTFQKQQKLNKEASTVPSSGGYLAKPAQLYEQEQPNPKSKTVEEPTPMHTPVKVDEPLIEMQLVVKDSLEAAEPKEQNVHQPQPIMMSSGEDLPMADEIDDPRRRAMERIAKLRNLSFNLNAADPNNEFESVPAYLRRNMELHNSIADVETFYSNYTVKSDQNNQAEISTINTFLDGKKPD